MKTRMRKRFRKSKLYLTVSVVQDFRDGLAGQFLFGVSIEFAVGLSGDCGTCTSKTTGALSRC